MTEVLVPAPVTVSDAIRLRSALTYHPTSPADAVRYLDRAEGVYETLLRDVRPGEIDALILAKCERLILDWAQMHRRLLPYARYRATIGRVEVREPQGWARRMYDLGTLPAVAEFLGQLDSPPGDVTDTFATVPEFQPLAEIAFQGVRGALVVHIGNAAYAGALVIVSETEPPRHRIIRMLGFETPHHGPIVRISNEDDGVVLAPRGVITVECVIFNRRDLLPCI